MLKISKFYVTLVVFISFSIFLIGCKKKMDADAEKVVISVKGSDTMVNLSQKWAEEYMNENKNVSIQVTGGGSGTGIASLLNGTVNLANASREMKEIEIQKAKQNNINPIQFKVAMDGISVIVHKENKVDSLTMQQIADIYTGKTKNWKDVGGANLPITLYGRENSSGTYEFFKEHVLSKKDFATSTQVLQGTAALGEAVARDTKGIGYGGVGYFALRNDVKIIKVKKDEKSPAVSPIKIVDGKHQVNYEIIWNKDYSISRYLYCYTNGEPKGEIKNFIDFIVNPDKGQKSVETMEYIPLPKTL